MHARTYAQRESADLPQTVCSSFAAALLSCTHMMLVACIRMNGRVAMVVCKCTSTGTLLVGTTSPGFGEVMLTEMSSNGLGAGGSSLMG